MSNTKSAIGHKFRWTKQRGWSVFWTPSSVQDSLWGHAMLVFLSCCAPLPPHFGNRVMLYSPWRENIFQKFFFLVFPILFKVSTLWPLSPLFLWVRSSSLLRCPLYYFPLTFGITLFQSLQYIPIKYYLLQTSNLIIHLFKNFWVAL